MKKSLNFAKRGMVKRKLDVMNGVSIASIAADDMLYEFNNAWEDKVQKLNVKRRRLMNPRLTG